MILNIKISSFAEVLKGSGNFLVIKAKLLENGICNFKLNEFILNSTIYEANKLEIIVGNVKIEEEKILQDYQLNQNYPNPFNPTTNIKYTLAAKSFVNLSVFDIRGRCIECLVNNFCDEGNYNIRWNASPYPSGIYIYSIRVKNKDGTEVFQDIKKLTLIK